MSPPDRSVPRKAAGAPALAEARGTAPEIRAATSCGSRQAGLPWYAGGLRFACVRGCTRCCRGFPGDVFVTGEEIAAIASFMRITESEFRDVFLRPAGVGKLSLRERGDYECVMLESDGCSIYPVRPRQCRTFPFWPEILASADAWARQALTCPGINDGTFYTREQIEAIAGIS
ncbi:MAG: YkgJ family cysteine cluster protein [Planctomycetota bacterium]|nr:YkgJ family cysteine cluster protein [Planctomycetota bacterium]